MMRDERAGGEEAAEGINECTEYSALGASLFKKIIFLVNIFRNVVYRGSRLFSVTHTFPTPHFKIINLWDDI